MANKGENPSGMEVEVLKYYLGFYFLFARSRHWFPAQRCIAFFLPFSEAAFNAISLQICAWGNAILWL